MIVTLRKSFRTGAALAATFAIALTFAAQPSHAFRYVQEGEMSPQFFLETLDGKTLNLHSAKGEKATVLLFWADWSPRSHEALADYEKLYLQYRSAGLQIIAVNVEGENLDPRELEKIGTAALRAGASYPVVIDRELDVFASYGVDAVPSSLLLDSLGTISHIFPGYPNHLRDEFRDRVLDRLGLLPKPVYVMEEEAQLRPKGKAMRHYRMALLFRKKNQISKTIDSLKKALQEDADYQEARELLERMTINRD